MRLPRKRGSHRFRRGTESEMLLDMRAILFLSLPELLWSDRRFFLQHHGNIVTHGIDTAARFAFQARAVSEQCHRLLANGANQNVEKFLGNGHMRLRQGWNHWMPSNLALYQRACNASNRLPEMAAK